MLHTLVVFTRHNKLATHIPFRHREKNLFVISFKVYGVNSLTLDGISSRGRMKPCYSKIFVHSITYFIITCRLAPFVWFSQQATSCNHQAVGSVINFILKLSSTVIRWVLSGCKCLCFIYCSVLLPDLQKYSTVLTAHFYTLSYGCPA